MKRYLLFLALAARVFAADAYIPIPGIGPCTFSNVTGNGVTPFVVTVVDRSKCGNPEVGDLVTVTEIKNSTGSNSSGNWNSDSTDHLARKISARTGSALTLTTISGAAITGNGTWLTNSGRLMKAQAVTMPAHPRVYFNPALLSSIANTSSTGRAYASRQEWIDLKYMCDTWAASAWGQDRTGAKAAGFAMCWKATGTTSYRDKALFLLNQMDAMLPSSSCDTATYGGCALPDSSQADYPTQNLENWSVAYTALHAELASTDTTIRDKVLAYTLTDREWFYGGLGPTGTTKTAPTWRILKNHGTVTVTGSSVTGVGTTFVTDGVQIGEIFMVGDDGYANACKITAVNSETSLTLGQTDCPPGGGGSGHTYLIGTPWSTSTYGLMYMSKHYNYSPLCGNSLTTLERSDDKAYTNGVESLCQFGYPAPDGLQAIYANGTINLTLARLQGMVAWGAATCGDDIRGCLLFEQAVEFMAGIQLARGLNMWTGFTASTPGYQTGRMHNIPISISNIVRNSTVEAVDYIAGTNLARNLMKWGYSAPMPDYVTNEAGSGMWIPNYEGTVNIAYKVNYQSTPMWRGPLTAMGYDPGNAEAAKLRWFFANLIPFYTSGFQQYNNGEYLWFLFLWNDPTITPVQPGTTQQFDTTHHDTCVAIYGSSNCPTNEYRTMVVSRSDWTTAQTLLFFNAASFRCTDHCPGPGAGGSSYDNPGWLLWMKNTRVLIGNDTNLGDSLGFRPTRSNLEFGGTSDTIETYDKFAISSRYWTSGNDSTDYMVANYNFTQKYKPATGVTKAAEQMIDLKYGSQSYTIYHQRAEASSQQIRSLLHFQLNGCGTPNATTCVVADLTNKTVTSTFTSPNARGIVKAIGLGGTTIKMTTADGNAAHGSYSGGLNTTFRTEVCPSTDGGSTCDTSEAAAEWAYVMKASTSTSDAMPTTAAGVCGDSFRTIEIRDSSAPKFAIFTEGGTTDNDCSASITASATVQALATGVAPNTYDWTLDGSPVSGCQNLVVTAGDNTMQCLVAVSGTQTLAFAVDGSPSPVTVTTSSPLPGGTVGVSYSQSLAASGGTSPYTWDQSSGTMCDGLTLNSDGTITGTATTAQTCTFTGRATDSLSATGTKSFQITIDAATATPGSRVGGNGRLGGNSRLQ